MNSACRNAGHATPLSQQYEAVCTSAGGTACYILGSKPEGIGRGPQLASWEIDLHHTGSSGSICGTTSPLPALDRSWEGRPHTPKLCGKTGLTAGLAPPHAGASVAPNAEPSCDASRPAQGCQNRPPWLQQRLGGQMWSERRGGTPAGDPPGSFGLLETPPRLTPHPQSAGPDGRSAPHAAAAFPHEVLCRVDMITPCFCTEYYSSCLAVLRQDLVGGGGAKGRVACMTHQRQGSQIQQRVQLDTQGEHELQVQIQHNIKEKLPQKFESGHMILVLVNNSSATFSKLASCQHTRPGAKKKKKCRLRPGRGWPPPAGWSRSRPGQRSRGRSGRGGAGPQHCAAGPLAAGYMLTPPGLAHQSGPPAAASCHLTICSTVHVCFNYTFNYIFSYFTIYF